MVSQMELFTKELGDFKNKFEFKWFNDDNKDNILKLKGN